MGEDEKNRKRLSARNVGALQFMKVVSTEGALQHSYFSNDITATRHFQRAYLSSSKHLKGQLGPPVNHVAKM